MAMAFAQIITTTAVLKEILFVAQVIVRSSKQDFDFHFLFLSANSPENRPFSLIFPQLSRFG